MELENIVANTVLVKAREGKVQLPSHDTDRVLWVVAGTVCDLPLASLRLFVDIIIMAQLSTGQDDGWAFIGNCFTNISHM